MDRDLRQSARAQLASVVGFKRHGDGRYQVGLFNLSAGGCCLSPPVRLDPGDRVSVRIPSLAAIHGQVTWSAGWKTGVRFDQPFHPAVLEQLVASLGDADDQRVRT